MENIFSPNTTAKPVRFKNGKLKVMHVTDTHYDFDNVEASSWLLACACDKEKPDIVIVDSIQTMEYSEISSSPGSVTQVRESASVFMRTAKSLGIPIILVGHVNKDGNIAGPKVLEHIVDAVLYFEGNRNFSYRILRAVKNRYGS
jgi:predicted ATP-dependent serine protease